MIIDLNGILFSPFHLFIYLFPLDKVWILRQISEVLPDFFQSELNKRKSFQYIYYSSISISAETEIPQCVNKIFFFRN